MPLVSVIIPAYNAEKTIQETVESVLRQTFKDFELLIINDGSTDRTAEIVSQIEDSRIKLFNFVNGGVAESRNRGILHSQGEYLSFLDADDLWKPDKLTDQLAAFTKQPEAKVAYTWNDYIDVEGNFVHHGYRSVYEGDVYEEIFIKCFIENGSNVLIRRDAAEQVGLFDSRATPAEDWDFYLRLAEKFPFVCVPKAHVSYRIVPSSLSSQIERMECGGLTVLHKALQRSPERLNSLGKMAFADFYSYLFHKAYLQAVNRHQYWTALKIFGRGVYASPRLWNKVAKRRLWHTVRKIVAVPT